MNNTSILIVNGGKDPEEGKWLTLYLEKLYKFTDPTKFNLIVWNNNVVDENITFLKSRYSFDLLEPIPNDKMFHPHAVPLQRLFNYATIKYKSEAIILMDSDAFPVKTGWFEELTEAVKSGKYVLAGIWRDELKGAIQPYIHPSCMCFSTQFARNNNLILDFYGINTETKKHDTLSYFTEKAIELNGKLYKLNRSNKNNFHRLMGGIYGDYVYHHGAGSRDDISFWDEIPNPQKRRINRAINTNASKLLFQNFESYINWLKGDDVSNDLYSIITLDQQKSEIETKKNKSINLIRRIKSAAARTTDKQKDNPQKSDTDFFNNMQGMPTENDFTKLRKPAGCEYSLPDIVGLGVPKAGTSLWFDNLLSHPHIVPHRFYDQNRETSKELHFFTHLGHHPINEGQKEIYKKCFLKQDGVLCAEFSTIYFSNLMSLNNLLNTVKKETIFVLILRNPIDRYISHINHVMSNRAKGLGLNDKDRLDRFYKYSVIPESIYYSLYSNSLEYLLSRVDKNKIYIDTYENFRTDPEKSYRDFIDFIGVRQYYIGKYHLDIDYKKPKNVQNYIIEKPTSEERVIIAENFRSDVSRLKSILPDLKLDSWDF